MSAPTMPVILFRKPPKPLTYSQEITGSFGYPGPPYTAAHIAEKMHGSPVGDVVFMYRTDWFFQDTTFKGIPSKYVPGRCKELDGVDSPRGVIVPGYRCDGCHRVFFGSELEDFRHECMEAD